MKHYTVRVDQGSQPGDGFIAELFSVTINETLTGKKLELICKSAPQSDGLLSDGMGAIFDREAFVYDVLLPTFYQFQREKNLPERELFKSYPKCYASVVDHKAKHFAILMENLRPQGFKMWDKSKPARCENVRVLLGELGKFHGISIAFKDQKPTEFLKFKELSDCRKAFFGSENMREIRDTILDRVIGSLKNGNHKIVVEDVKKNYMPYLEDCVDGGAADRFGVICHGILFNILGQLNFPSYCRYL